MVYHNWKLTGTLDARQHDNLRILVISGNFPDGWDWDLFVSFGENLDMIHLEKMDDGVGTVLTADQLCFEGYYTMQLRGCNGDEVRHTNQIKVFVGASMSGDGQWPEIPTAFTDLEKRVNADAATAEQAAATASASAGDAEAAASRYPYIGPNGNWFVWDVTTGEYQDTGISAGGSGGGGGGFPELGHALYYDETGRLAVQVADKPEPDNTLPITSAAMQTTVGNIEILLGTI